MSLADLADLNMTVYETGQRRSAARGRPVTPPPLMAMPLTRGEQIRRALVRELVALDRENRPFLRAIVAQALYLANRGKTVV